MAPTQRSLIPYSRYTRSALALAIVLSITLFPMRTPASEILLGTDAVGTFSHFAGRAISRVIAQHADGQQCRAVPAPDRIHNLTNLQGGSIDLALIDISRLHDAVRKKGDFTFLDIQYDNLALVAPVYKRTILLIARADAGIDALDDLKGKKINAGPPRSQTDQEVKRIMGAKGWTQADFTAVDALPPTLSQDTMAFCHGTVQAMLHIGVHPDSALQKLVELCNALPVDMADADTTRMIQDHPGYLPVQIPENVYPAFGRSITTIGVTVALVASGSLDDATMGEIMAALDQHRQTLQNTHPAMQTFMVDVTMPEIGIARHPGAAAYFEQRR
ncbi:MAG: TAXI family TRAP transporter solute-binding subunit [Desulfosarcinaceae bacterium]|nr:TAXI family TRAP transporter solute-binding subunit [Desulfosarcinaceae bacterium]